MLSIHNSTATAPNRRIRKRVRKRSEDNLDWLARHLPSLLKRYRGPRSAILLVGGRDTASARLRAAQARARQDLSPSHWSHVALLDLTGRHVRAPTTEISLMPSSTRTASLKMSRKNVASSTSASLAPVNMRRL